LAVGLGVSEAEGPMTNDRCTKLIVKQGANCNPLSGIKGLYYTTEREKDLRQLAAYIIQERQEKGQKT